MTALSFSPLTLCGAIKTSSYISRKVLMSWLHWAGAQPHFAEVLPRSGKHADPGTQEKAWFLLLKVRRPQDNSFWGTKSLEVKGPQRSFLESLTYSWGNWGASSEGHPSLELSPEPRWTFARTSSLKCYSAFSSELPGPAEVTFTIYSEN